MACTQGFGIFFCPNQERSETVCNYIELIAIYIYRFVWGYITSCSLS